MRPRSPAPAMRIRRRPDARHPAALQRFADELARQVAEHDVADEEDAPDEARDFEGADVALRFGRVVGLEVQRADRAQHDGENAADQDVEEIVDARAPAPQPIEALEVEADRHHQRDERQHPEVLLDRRLAARDLEQPGFKAQQVGQEEPRHAEHRVGDHMEGDQQAVVALYHCWPAGAFKGVGDDVADLGDEALARESLRVRANARRVPRGVGRAGQALGQRLDRRVGDEDAGLAVDHRVERAATAERHDGPAGGLRFDRHDAEIFLARQDGRDRRAIELANVFVGLPADQLDAVAGEPLQPLAFRAVADHGESNPGAAGRHHREIDALVRHQGGHDEKVRAGSWGHGYRRLSRGGCVELCIDRGIHKGRLTIIVQPRSSAQHIEK